MLIPEREKKMAERIAENLYKQVVPLPNNPLREINVYIIKGERNLIIDTGFNRPECEEVIRAALDELDIKSADILVTHLHSDHCGLVPKLAFPDSTIYASEIDGEIMNFETRQLYWDYCDEQHIKYGFPRAEFGRNTDIHPGRKYLHDKMMNFTYLKDGDVIEYGGYKLKAVIVSGHTPAMLTLYDENRKIYFCADHILGTITPNISPELFDENPLKDYLDSLNKVKDMEVDMLLPAHGTHIESMRRRIEELFAHHTKRLAEAESILGPEWKNAYEVAGDMTWEIDCRNWDDFPKPQKWFATGEAISHLQYLYYEGKLDKKEENGIIMYRRKQE